MTMKLEDLKLAVIGLGYVGLPLAVEFGRIRNVIGFDINPKRIEQLRSVEDITLETDPAELDAAGHLVFTTDLSDLFACNCFIVTVPPPIDEHKRPDLTPLLRASESVGKVLKKGDLVIYESTVYPGCTEEDCPDLRNTRVIDIIKELQDYNCDVDVCDPWADPVSAMHEYGIELVQDPAPGRYDAVVIAVAHRRFRDMGVDMVRSLAAPVSVVYDVKSAFRPGDSDLRL